MKKKVSRRELLKAMVAVLGAGVVSGGHLRREILIGRALEMNHTLFLPLLKKEHPYMPAPTGKVVHLYSPAATSWDGTNHKFWNYVDQKVVDEMVDQGLMILTSQSSVEDAWRVLLPDYQVGKAVAIKANFNNSTSCNDTDQQIDALIQPVNSIVRGLKSIGVIESDIWVYDAIRLIPNRFVLGCQYQNIRYFDNGCRNMAGFSSNTLVKFNPPPGVNIAPIRVTDVLVNASYLINMPIMKGHGLTGATVSFKNHFGSINLPSELHEFVGLTRGGFRVDYSPFVDLYNSTHIGGKTILTIGDGLFAARYQWTSPQVWSTFGNQVPNSLFFAIDPVAADCVMFDFLDAEFDLPDASYDFLRLADEAGLGIFERGDPWGSGYSLIDYLKIVV